MRTRNPFLIALAAAVALMAFSQKSAATEYAFSTYGLGGNAFGAGATPPPGTYVTEATAFYSASIGTTVSFGGVTLNPGAKVDAFSAATNILYVPERKVLGGNLGLSVTIPVGHIDIDATLGGPFGLSRSVDGWGFGDVWSKVQLGWQHGEFAHTIYVQAVAPTGRRLLTRARMSCLLSSSTRRVRSPVKASQAPCPSSTRRVPRGPASRATQSSG